MANSGERLKQGVHPDPLAPDFEAPDPTCLSRAWTAALASPEMAAYRAGLGLPNQSDIRAAILDDLSTYYLLDPQECLRRRLNWEAWSVEEWRREDRSTPEGIRAFYNSTFSWSFDLLWYAYLQAEGVTYPTSVVVAQQLPMVTNPARCLDFGSGVGDAAQLLRKPRPLSSFGTFGSASRTDI